MEDGEAERLLAAMRDGVTRAGDALLGRFAQSPVPAEKPELWAALRENDRVSEAILRPTLEAALATARWDENEEGEGALPAGDWWVCDTSEGNINHVHDRSSWCVTATLVREGRPVLTAIYVPLTGETFTASEGGGTERNGIRLSVSAKTDLAIAMVGTGQAVPGENEATRRRLERDVGCMLDRALLVRMSVPSTIELIDVASGRLDAFWQPSAVRSGLLSGALLVREAGGLVTDFAGELWTLSSSDFLASSPGIHAAMSAALAQ